MNRPFILGCVLVWILTCPAVAQFGRRHQPRSGTQPPHLMMERLNRMNPEERERLLKGLPPARRTALEDRLRRYEEMPPAAKERLRRDYDEFQSLTPEKQDEARKLFHRLSQVPEERRRDLRREIVRLRNMRPERRDARMSSDRFRSEFNDDERQVLQGLVDVLPNSAPPPGAGPMSRPAQSPLTH